MRVPSSRVLSILLLVVALGVAAVWGFNALGQPRAVSADARTTALARQIKCPVCNGESAADSAAPIAVEMRSVIRQKVAAGESDQEILTYFRQRYGDDILLAPPKAGFDLIAWLAPVVALVLGGVAIFSLSQSWMSRARGAVAEPLPAPASGDDRELRLTLRRAVAADEGLPEDGGSA
ncbi:MAG TPA: cytochrome c-type biogenesis protein CcmH [Ktedonobacterales bacterium]